MRKTLAGCSANGVDKDPPRKNIEKSHTLYNSIKRKINTQATWLSIPEPKKSLELWMLMNLLKNPIGMSKDYWRLEKLLNP